MKLPYPIQNDDRKAGEELYVFHYNENENKWEALEHVRRGVDPTTGILTVTALATSFSPFGLFNERTVAGGVATKQLNAAILPRLVQAMVASTAASVERRMDATFSASRGASYQLDGQTVQLDDQITLSNSLQDTVQNKLPTYMMSLKDDTMDWKQIWLSRMAADCSPHTAK